MAIAQDPAARPARPVMRMVCAASDAPATPATRLRLDTSPSLAPSTWTRIVLPETDRWLAWSAAKVEAAPGGGDGSC
jgi:hypothetical protein